jgi:hypothetical protein
VQYEWDPKKAEWPDVRSGFVSSARAGRLEGKPMATKKTVSRRGDGMRREYDLSELKNPVRGKYYAQAMAGTNVVLLDPDVADAFPDAKSVNDVLRVLVNVARSRVRVRRRARR